MSVSNEHGVTALVAHHIDGQLCPYCGQVEKATSN